MRDAFRGLSCQFWSAVQQCGAWLQIHTKLLDRVVNGTRFLTGGEFEYDIAHRRAVAVLCMLYNIRCNPLHPLYGALPVLYVPVRVTFSALVAHQYAYAPPCCKTSQYHRNFSLLSVSPWNDLADPVFDVVGLAGFKSRASVIFYRPKMLAPFSSSTAFHFSSFFLLARIVGLGSLL